MAAVVAMGCPVLVPSTPTVVNLGSPVVGAGRPELLATKFPVVDTGRPVLIVPVEVVTIGRPVLVDMGRPVVVVVEVVTIGRPVVVDTGCPVLVDTGRPVLMAPVEVAHLIHWVSGAASSTQDTTPTHVCMRRCLVSTASEKALMFFEIYPELLGHVMIAWKPSASRTLP